jgi:diguanylate cyclase (GGDEF)-like protein/PAS domain S-box-containing protein
MGSSRFAGRHLAASRGLLVVVAVGLTAALVAVAAGGVAGLRWRFLLIVLAMAGVAVGVSRNAPSRRRPWYLLLGGMALSASGDVTVLLASRAGPLTANVPADAWLTAMSGVLFLAGLLDATRPFRPGERGSALDAVVAALASGAVLWQAVVVPAAAPGWAGSGTELAGALQVSVLLGVLVLLGRLTRSMPAGHRLAAATLTVGVAAAVGAFLLGAFHDASGGDAYSGVRASLGAAANLAAAAAVLHPSMRTITDRRPVRVEGVSLPRTLLLGLALAAPPGVLLVSSARGVEVSLGSLAVTWVVLAVAVLTRIHLLQRGWETSRSQLARSEQRLVSLVANTGDTVLLVAAPVGTAPRIRFASPSCRRLTGREPAEVRRLPLHALTEPEDAEALLALVAGEGPLPRVEDVRVRHLDGSHRWVEAVVDRAPEQEGERSVVLTLRDVDERKRTELELAEVALRDELTGLWNRRGILGLVAAALAGPAEPGRCVGIVLADLDGFKAVNDRSGHASGDEVLRSLARRFERAVRDGDAVGRIGGDEFVVLCTVDGPGTAATIADRVLAAGADPIEVDGTEHHVGVSAGVALARPGTNVAELLSRADIALYRAKAAGKNRAWFAEDLDVV